MKRNLALTLALLLGIGGVAAQTDSPSSQAPQDSSKQVPTFRVNVVGRTTQAVNWHNRSGWTKVDFKGTDLMPGAKGQARVRSQAGRIEVETQVKDLSDPQQFGKEYLTYVLWAITPEGRAKNLGEIVRDENSNTKPQTFTTDLQAFALLITAEPYFAVTQPSNLVCLENIVRKDTVGATEPINVHYELLERGAYITAPEAYTPILIDRKLPFDLYQAQNAVRIAADNGAQKYAPEAYQRAVTRLEQAQDYASRKRVESKPIATVAREAAQQAQDALDLTLRRKEDERIANERAAAAERQRQAEQEASAAQQKAQADAAARAAAESQRQAAEQQAQQAAAERSRAEEQARLAAQQQQQAQQAAAQAQAEREALRQKLLQQFNSILATRDTARGLIANLSDVLFATDSYQLTPQAKLSLARFAGIVQAYPGLHLEIEGNTDSTGNPEYNQRLSEKRANSVRDFLLSQGVKSPDVTASGLGEDNPVASNDTATGRHQNRRVEIIVSGEVIGQALVPQSGNRGQAPITAPEQAIGQQAAPAPQTAVPPTTTPQSAPVTNPTTPR